MVSKGENPCWHKAYPLHSKCQTSCYAGTTRKSSKRRISSETRLRCSSTPIEAKVKFSTSNSGGVPESPLHKKLEIKLYVLAECKNSKDCNSRSEHRGSFVFDFTEAPETQVQLRWQLIQSSPNPPAKEKQKIIRKIYTMITMQRYHRRNHHRRPPTRPLRLFCAPEFVRGASEFVCIAPEFSPCSNG